MKMQNSIQISTYGISDEESIALTTTVKLLHHDGITAQIRNDRLSDAHLLVINMDSSQGKEALCASRVGQVKLVLSDTPRKGKNVISILKPIDIMALKNVLGKVLTKMQQQLASLSPIQSEQPESKTDSTDVITNTVFHLLLSTKENKKYISITSEGHPEVLVDGENNSVVTVASKGDLSKMVRMPLDTQQVKDINAQLIAAEKENMTISSLHNLLWMSAISCSKGRLLPGHDVEHKVKLRAWPNFTRNDFRPSHLKLAAIMAQRPVSISELGALTGVAQEEVIAFYNAAYSVDLIDKNTVSDKEEGQAREVSKEKKSLFSRIANRLGFGEQNLTAAGL